MTDSETNEGATPPLKTIRLKPIQPQAPAPAPAPAPSVAPAAAAAPAPAAVPHFSANPIPGAKQTIRLRPSTMSGIGGTHPQQTPVPTSSTTTDTSRLARRTIKLTAANHSASPDATLKMEKQASAAAAPAAAPGTPTTDTSRLSKRTIKLTASKPIEVPPAEPAAGAPASAEGPASQPTIKLNANPASQQTIKLNANPASQQTIKLNANPASQQTIKLNANPASQQTIKLNANPASQQTIKLGAGAAPAPGGVASQTIKLGAPAGKAGQTLRLTKPVQPEAPIEPATAAGNEAAPETVNPLEALKQKHEKAADTPLTFVITSAVALLVLGLLCFVLYAQYSNFYQGGNINVPGLKRLTGK